MSILTFGVGQENVGAKEKEIGGISEELRDEKLNLKLMEGYKAKQSQDWLKAHNSFQEVLDDDVLKTAKIQKHLFMLFNAHKNIAEVYEQMRNFVLAKFHYTQALKLRQQDSFIWTRLGLLEFEQFQSLETARECLETASNTLSALERRSSKICPILVKLAELNFLLYDFNRAEQLVDAILKRPNQGGTHSVFAFLLKAYFMRLDNQHTHAEMLIQRAKMLQKDACVEKLDVVLKMDQNCPVNQKLASLRVNYNGSESEKQAYYARKNVIVMDKSDFDSFPEIIAHFVNSINDKTEELSLESNPTKNALEESLFDPTEFLKDLIQKRDILMQNWDTDFTQYQRTVFLNEQDHERKVESQNSEDFLEQQIKDEKDKPKAIMNKKVTEMISRRAQRRRGIEGTTQVLKQIKVKDIENYKQNCILQNDDQNQMSQQQNLLKITSLKEICQFQKYFEEKKNEQIENKKIKNCPKNQQTDRTHLFVNVPQKSYLTNFVEFIEAVSFKSVIHVIRRLLKFFTESSGTHFACPQISFAILSLFRQVQLATKKVSPEACNLFEITNLDQFGSIKLLLTMFEISLFNEEVIRKIKSGPIMEQRSILYNYLVKLLQTKSNSDSDHSQNYDSIELIDCKKQLEIVSLQNGSDFAEEKGKFFIRLHYALMYYAFEIQNDMPQSVAIFQEMDMKFLKQSNQIRLAYLDESYRVLDRVQVESFGMHKIQEARKKKDYDSALLHLRSQEVSALKKGKKQGILEFKISEQQRDKCFEYAQFYLEQFFVFLSQAEFQDSNSSSQSDQSSVSGVSAHEKAKEMWDKLCYSLARSPCAEFFKLFHYMMAALTGFKLINPNFYTNFILQKLNFEEYLLQEANEKLKHILSKVWQTWKETRSSDQSQQAMLITLNDLLRSKDSLMELTRIQLHLIRFVEPEFIHHVAKRCVQQSQDGENENLLMQSIFRGISSAQIVRDLIQDTSTSGLDQMQSVEKFQLRGLLNLLGTLDLIAHKNLDLLVRPYIRTIQFCFPYILHIFSIQLEAGQHKKRHLERVLDSDIASIIAILFQFFFKIQTDFDDVAKLVRTPPTRFSMVSSFNEPSEQTIINQKSEQNDNNDSDQSESEESEEEDSITDFRTLVDLSKNIGGTRKTIGLNLIQKQSTKNGVLDVQFVADLIRTLDFCYQGRIMNHGTLNYQELEQIVDIVDLVGKIVFERRNWIQEICPAAKERHTKIKNCFREPIFGSELESLIGSENLKSGKCPCVSQNLKTSSCYSPSFSESISTITLFLMNVFSTVGLSAASCFSETIPFKVRQTLLSKMSSLNDLLRLRVILHIDFHFGNHVHLSCLFMSYVFQQLFQTSRESRILDSFKATEEYKGSRQNYKKALNCALMALMISQKMPSSSRINSPLWKQINSVEFNTLVYHQLLKIQTLRIKSKQYAIYFDQSKKKPSKSEQILATEVQFYAMVCESLQKLGLPKTSDPRAAMLPIEKIKEITSKIQELLPEQILSEFQSNQKALEHEKNPILTSGLISQRGIETCKSKLEFLINDPGISTKIKSSLKSNLSCTYPLIQAQFEEYKQDQDTLKSLINKMNSLQEAFEVSIASSDYFGCLSVLLVFLEESFKIAIQLKYQENKLSIQTKTTYHQLITAVIKPILGKQTLSGLLNDLLCEVDSSNDDRRKMDQEMQEEDKEQNCGENMKDSLEVDQIVVDRVASTTFRQKLMRKNPNAISQGLNQSEIILNRLYDLGENLIRRLQIYIDKFALIEGQGQGKQNLDFQNLPQVFLKVKFAYLLDKSVIAEYTLQEEIDSENQANTGCIENSMGWVVLKEMQQQTVKELQVVEELLQNYFITSCNMQQTQNSSIYTFFSGNTSSEQLLRQVLFDSLAQNFLGKMPQVSRDLSDQRLRIQRTLLSETETGIFQISLLKAKVKDLKLQICEKNLEYEHVRDEFRKYQIVLKHSLINQSEARSRFVEINYTFRKAMNMYVTLLIKSVQEIFKKMMGIRLDIKNHQRGQKTSVFAANLQAYKVIKKKYSASVDNQPQILKDAFELFIESHNSKQFLKRMNLLDSEIILQIRRMVVKICAICGPDADINPTKGATYAFLNLTQITSDDYLFEALQISLKWYARLLEGAIDTKQAQSQAKGGTGGPRGDKKVIETRKKINETLAEIQRMAMNEQLAQQRQEFGTAESEAQQVQRIFAEVDHESKNVG